MLSLEFFIEKILPAALQA